MMTSYYDVNKVANLNKSKILTVAVAVAVLLLEAWMQFGDRDKLKGSRVERWNR